MCDWSMLGLQLIHVSKRAQIVFRYVRFNRFVLFVPEISNYIDYKVSYPFSNFNGCTVEGKVWSSRAVCIWWFGDLSSRLYVSNSGTRTLFDWKRVVFLFHSCKIWIVWGLWSQSNFHDVIMSIINIFWLHWSVNHLVVTHPYALSHNKAVLNWNNFVWSIGLISIQGLIVSTSNSQQTTDTVS